MLNVESQNELKNDKPTAFGLRAKNGVQYEMNTYNTQRHLVSFGRKMKTCRPTSSSNLRELDSHILAKQTNVPAIIRERQSMQIAHTARSDDMQSIHCVK